MNGKLDKIKVRKVGSRQTVWSTKQNWEEKKLNPLLCAMLCTPSYAAFHMSGGHHASAMLPPPPHVTMCDRSCGHIPLYVVCHLLISPPAGPGKEMDLVVPFTFEAKCVFFLDQGKTYVHTSYIDFLSMDFLS